MATATRRIAEVANGGAYVEFVYEDTTMVVSRVNWVNNLDRPALGSVVNGADTIFSGTIRSTNAAATVPAGALAANSGQNLTTQRRFNWETASLRVNLSPWRAPTVP